MRQIERVEGYDVHDLVQRQQAPVCAEVRALVQPDCVGGRNRSGQFLLRADMR